jgi:hypothetical protein
MIISALLSHHYKKAQPLVLYGPASICTEEPPVFRRGLKTGWISTSDRGGHGALRFK